MPEKQYTLKISAPMIQAMVLLLPTLALGAGNELTHGISVGDVTTDTAIVWGRCSSSAVLSVEAKPIGGASKQSAVTGKSQAMPDGDFTAQVELKSLNADQTYEVTVACAGERGTQGKAERATFRTAPLPDQSRPISFIVGADLGGQTYCRPKDGGYRIFKPMTALRPDFFIANGDMIYADDHCPERGFEPGVEYIPGGFPNIADRNIDWSNPELLDTIYRDHWKYNRADPAFQEFLRQVPQYVQWDDHEVVNDFGAQWLHNPHQPKRPGYPTLVQRGVQSLFDYHPLSVNPDEPMRIYRSFRWGKELEIFIIDARSYRSRNDRVDELDEKGKPVKEMLGTAQLEWLIEGLRTSDARWKLVSSNVPWSIPTGSHPEAFGSDAYANGQYLPPYLTPYSFEGRTGFELELLYMLGELDRANVSNLLVAATDVHYASQMRHQGDFDGDGDTLIFYELISGPLSAVRRMAPPAIDDTLNPVVLYAEGNIFNFAYMEIRSVEGEMHFITDIRDEKGQVRPGSVLEIRPM